MFENPWKIIFQRAFRGLFRNCSIKFKSKDNSTTFVMTIHVKIRTRYEPS